MTQKKKFTFTLKHVNIERIEQQYGINLTSNLYQSNDIPVKSTKVEDVLVNDKRPPEVISFLDESRRIRKCTISRIRFNSDTSYNCWWDHNPIPSTIQPIGCPVRYIAHDALKTYYSELSKDTYSIHEHVTDNRLNELKERMDDRFTYETKGFYETTGVFCSFNCCMAYILENKHDPLYNYSENLILKMYFDLYDQTELEILPAPHWKQLSSYGGNLTIEDFRSSFNRIEYTCYKTISCLSIGLLFEQQHKF